MSKCFFKKISKYFTKKPVFEHICIGGVYSIKYNLPPSSILYIM